MVMRSAVICMQTSGLPDVLDDGPLGALIGADSLEYIGKSAFLHDPDGGQVVREADTVYTA